MHLDNAPVRQLFWNVILNILKYLKDKTEFFFAKNNPRELSVNFMIELIPKIRNWEVSIKEFSEFDGEESNGTTRGKCQNTVVIFLGIHEDLLQDFPRMLRSEDTQVFLVKWWGFGVTHNMLSYIAVVVIWRQLLDR